MANGDDIKPGANAADPNIERVAGEDILKQYGVSGPVTQAGAQELGPLQKVGYKLARWVMVYIAICTVFILAFSFFPMVHFPPAPPTPAELTAEAVAQYKASVDNYKIAVDLATNMIKMQVERALQLFQLIVASTALPTFTAILGYIFGSRKAAD